MSGRPRPRILVTGTYCSLNRGDAAMQLACALGLRARIPDARIAIHAPFPGIDEPFYARYGLPVVPSSRRRLVRGTLLWARMAGAGRTARKAAPGRPHPPPDERRAIAEADLVVDLSGDMLTEDAGLHVAYSHYLPLLQALAAGTPLALCAQSVGPFRFSAPLARRILEGAELVTLRESRSLDHLERIGAEPRRLEVTADLSFALPPAPPDAVDAALAEEGLSGDGPWLGVSLSGLVERYRSRGGGAESLAAFLAPALRILLVPHVFGPKPIQDDRRALAELRSALDGRAAVVDGEHGPEVLKGIIGRCAVFVGARMHAVMAALSTAVPVLAIAYSHKAPGIMTEFEVGDRVIDAADATTPALTDALLALLEARGGLVSRLHHRADAAREAAERNLEVLSELATGGGT